jgi:hypothetical protein
MRVRVFPAWWLEARIVFGDAGQHHWRAVGKLSNQRKIASHGLDSLPERGQQKVAALLKA